MQVSGNKSVEKFLVLGCKSAKKILVLGISRVSQIVFQFYYVLLSR